MSCQTKNAKLLSCSHYGKRLPRDSHVIKLEYMICVPRTVSRTLKKAEMNSLMPIDAYMRRQPKTSLVQIMACRLYGAKPLSEPKLEYCQLNPWEPTSVKSYSKLKHFHSRKDISKCRLRNRRPFVSASMCLKNVLTNPMTLSIGTLIVYPLLMHRINALNGYMSMNSGMLFYFFKNRWPRANVARNITALAVHPRRIGEFKRNKK